MNANLLNLIQSISQSLQYGVFANESPMQYTGTQFNVSSLLMTQKTLSSLFSISAPANTTSTYFYNVTQIEFFTNPLRFNGFGYPDQLYPLYDLQIFNLSSNS